MHNIFDSVCLKGYSFRSKLGQFITAKETGEEAVRLDVQQCVCLSFKFCFLSVTVRSNMDKNHQCTAYIIKTDAEKQGGDLQSGMFLICLFYVQPKVQSSTYWSNRAATAHEKASSQSARSYDCHLAKCCTAALPACLLWLKT